MLCIIHNVPYTIKFELGRNNSKKVKYVKFDMECTYHQKQILELWQFFHFIWYALA